MSASYGILTVEGSMTSLHPEADVRQFMTEKEKSSPIRPVSPVWVICSNTPTLMT